MKARGSSFFLGVGIALVCLLLAVIAFVFLKPANRVYDQVTPVITVIPAPTLEPSPTYAPSLQPTATLSQDIPPDPGSKISMGINVSIKGTEGQGLRLRKDAGKNGTPVFLGAENEVFTVKDGPKQADGYTWWYLVGAADSTRAGWAVSNYLSPVE